MGIEEQDRQIGNSFVQREKLRKELNCIKNKMKLLSRILQETANALNLKADEQGGISFNVDYPTLQQIRGLCEDHDRVCAELRDTEQFLESVTVSARAGTQK